MPRGIVPVKWRTTSRIIPAPNPSPAAPISPLEVNFESRSEYQFSPAKLSILVGDRFKNGSVAGVRDRTRYICVGLRGRFRIVSRTGCGYDEGKMNQDGYEAPKKSNCKHPRIIGHSVSEDSDHDRYGKDAGRFVRFHKPLLQLQHIFAACIQHSGHNTEPPVCPMQITIGSNFTPCKYACSAVC